MNSTRPCTLCSKTFQKIMTLLLWKLNCSWKKCMLFKNSNKRLFKTFSPLVSFFTSGNTMRPLYDLSLTHSNTTSSLCFLISTMFLPLSPRDWIQALSAYATSSFLRAAELGAENREPWVVENAAIYLWNYSSQLLAAGEYQRLLPTFQTLVEMLRKTEYTG